MKIVYPAAVISPKSFMTRFLLPILFLLAISGENYAQTPHSAYAGMQWRVAGPFRAGWATVTSGVPDQPNIFYFGGAGGGVWKTTNAGRTWQALMQHKQSSAIGGLAVAPSNPNIIYAGTGQVTIRYDDMAGDGIYKSTDGGQTWKNVGLKETHSIGKVFVDPNNANHVLVAAMGHMFGPNPERGVYQTTDGGNHWNKVLYLNNNTGAIDIAADPKNPRIVYAALWQMRMHPWLDYFQPQVGPGSGIYKSTDGGSHWTQVPGKGFPSGASLGRIGLGVPVGSNGKTIYAVAATSDDKGGFYRSDDGGDSWKLVNNDPELPNDYFCRVTVSPDDPEEVWVMARSMHKSEDGGKHFKIVKGSPGGDDYHYLWINPKHPSYMISGADQGAAVSVDGGATWSSWYNQPTGQFYHIAVDDQFPYHIYSGQQDNGTVEIKNRGPYGVIEERDWHPVGGDERDYMVPKPDNPDIVFGSGLGGHVSRFHESTRQSASVSPWPVSSYGANPTKVKYRYTWIAPLVFSPIGKHTMYMGAQVLFKSDDDGDHWDIISPDLSGKRKNGTPGHDPDYKEAKALGFGVIYSIAPSSIEENRIWIGTDDGLIQLTTDGGKNWSNVTPPQIPEWGRVTAISPSHQDPHTAYAAIDLHRIDRFEPMLLKTTDDGQHWTEISTGIPNNEYTTVIRSDPQQTGLLYAGTNRTVYVSFNDGSNWEPLTQNFPTTWVRDLKVHNGDLIAGTQGRGIWVLDDVEPLRELAAGHITEHSAHLFMPEQAWRLRASENHDTPPPKETALGVNPPTGAVIDYWLKSDAQGPVTITIKDTEGKVVNSFSSDNHPKNLNANRYFPETWIKPDSSLSTKAGMHRFVWDLRYPRPDALNYSYSIAAVWHDGTPVTPDGPLSLPGQYSVTLSANGKTYTQPLTIKLDPRVNVTAEALSDQLSMALKVNAKLEEAAQLYRNVDEALKEAKIRNASQKRVDALTQIEHGDGVNLGTINGVLESLSGKIQAADAAPNQGQWAVYNHYTKVLADIEKRWEKLQ
ncbi:MAG: hypothetical protein PVH63_07045 [Balneolaceae bacterium]|jgi:photosystem II stability/assembly factor-like uncharacterized protein